MKYIAALIAFLSTLGCFAIGMLSHKLYTNPKVRANILGYIRVPARKLANAIHIRPFINLWAAIALADSRARVELKKVSI